MFVLQCCRKYNSMKLSLTVTVTGIASVVVGELLSSFLIRAVVHLLRGRWRRLNLGGHLVIKFLLIPLRLRCILVVCYYIAQYWNSSNSTHPHLSVSTSWDFGIVCLDLLFWIIGGFNQGSSGLCYKLETCLREDYFTSSLRLLTEFISCVYMTQAPIIWHSSVWRPQAVLCFAMLPWTACKWLFLL